jgi:hypothetical protein
MVLHHYLTQGVAIGLRYNWLSAKKRIILREILKRPKQQGFLY